MDELASLVDDLLKGGEAKDPFGAAAAVDTLRKALGGKRWQDTVAAHLSLLNRLDAFVTMLQLEDGDPADVLQNVTWQVQTEYTHDVMVVESDRLLTTEGYYIQKIDRVGTKLWRRSTPDENRRIAVNPNAGGGYVYTVAESDRVEIRDSNGWLVRDWSMLSDGTGLDYPYGIQVIQYPG